MSKSKRARIQFPKRKNPLHLTQVKPLGLKRQATTLRNALARQNALIRYLLTKIDDEVQYTAEDLSGVMEKPMVHFEDDDGVYHLGFEEEEKSDEAEKTELTPEEKTAFIKARQLGHA